MDEQNMQVVMGLIMHGGNAKGKAIEAIRAAKEFDFQLAEAKLEEANEEVNLAHRSQTNLLSQEASGDKVDVSMLLIHGQDHLMNAITTIDLAKEIVSVYRKVKELEDKTNDGEN